MSYDEKTDRMNWHDEISWIAISFVSGLLLSLFFIYLDRFPETNNITLYAICCVSFYFLSILVRIQNHRGKLLTGKTVINEKYLQIIFPLLGFGIGFALVFFI